MLVKDRKLSIGLDVAYADEDGSTSDNIDETEYTKEPKNRVMKTMLRWRTKSITGINNIKVTAKFSIYDDTDVLNIIKDALLSSLEAEITNVDNLTKETIEGYSVEFATTETKDALNKIKGLFPNVI